MNFFLRVAATLAAITLSLLLLLSLGLLIKPRPFAQYPEVTPPLQRVPLPTGLPDPVERYFRVAVGDQIPLIHSAVMSGRADLRLQGIPLPSRWRFTHVAGQDYRHFIEVTLFGRPLMKVNEHYVGGKARLELPMGIVANDPKTDSAANLGLWGETMFLPPVFLTNPRVRWEPDGPNRAVLVVPFGVAEDRFIVTFDPETGLIRSMETMRWKEPSSLEKTGWLLEPLSWARFDGMLLPTRFTITWADDRKPWFVGTLEEIIYNADVKLYIQAKGP